VALAFVVLCGLALAPVVASGDTVAYTWSGMNLNGLTGTVDIGTQALIITDPNSATYTSVAGSSYTGYAAIQQACQDSLNNNNGPFTGPGLISAQAALDWQANNGNPPFTTGIGILYNDDGSGDQLYSSFFGVNTPLDCLILRYTYMGDTLLQGTVTTGDYGNWEYAWYNGLSNNYSPSSFGSWFDGNFVYDTLTGGAGPTVGDYGLWEQNWAAIASNGQGGIYPSFDNPGPTNASDSVASATAAVPEPASIVLLLGGLVALFSMKLIRRRAR
jgi:hypothetical protein